MGHAVARFDRRNLALSTALERHLVVAPASGASTPHDLRVLDEDEGRVVIHAVLAAIALATLAATRRRSERAGALLHDVAIIMLALLLVSPKTWTAHYVWLFPAFLSVAAGVTTRSAAGLARAGLLALAGLMLLVPSQGVVGHEAAVFLRQTSVETLAVLLVWLVALALIPPGPRGVRTAPAPQG